MKATNEIEILEPRRLLGGFAVKVNFQPEASDPPAGYRVDYGAPFGRRANGLTYGWSADLRGQAIDRDAARSPSQARDTLIPMQPGGKPRRWEIALPNGVYRVRVSAGDAAVFGSFNKINAENTTLTRNTSSPGHPWISRAGVVQVLDGRLTLAPGSGASDTRINFVEIRWLDELPAPDPLFQPIANAFDYAEFALTRTLGDIGNNVNTFVERTRVDGSWRTVDRTHWAAGFLPGALWQLHARTANTHWSTLAKNWTLPLAPQVSQDGDLAFKFMTTYLPLYQMTGNPAYRQVLLDAAASKNAMWNSTVGAFRTTWFTTRSGNPRANFAVLMDMTTDMELLIWAWRQTGNQQYIQRAIDHTKKVIANQVRPNGSISQFGMYDAANGDFIMQETYQGYSNSSTWSRGQAWAILSLTMMARETGRSDFLAAARKTADYWIANVPPDFVPFWDFDHPQIPNTYRDSSAAAIAASGLLDLARVVKLPSDKARYLAAARNILQSLLGPSYWAAGSIHRGLIQHGAVNVPNDPFGRDNSIIYGDYYVLKAMNQYTPLASQIA